MQRYYILLKATGESGLPAWLPYRLTATSAELAVEKAKKMAEDHYREYKTFEAQVIENEGSYRCSITMVRGVICTSEQKQQSSR